jgi:cell filamentation protein
MPRYEESARDPYVDEETGILKNLLGCRTEEELSLKERELSYLRQTELWLHPIEPTFDLAHLQAIHQHLFQDAYSWAGRLRTIDISRDETLFAPHSRIEPYAQTVFAQLAAERHSIATIDLAGRLAHYLGEVNAMHPFREGNGRTQRIFIDQLAKENGHTILWSRCSQQEMIAASVAAHHRDSNMLADLIRRNLVPRIEALQSKVNSQELTPAAAVAEVERTRYLSASDRIKLHNAFENNTAIEIQRRLQYRIANSSEQSHRYRP